MYEAIVFTKTGNVSVFFWLTLCQLQGLYLGMRNTGIISWERWGINRLSMVK